MSDDMPTDGWTNGSRESNGKGSADLLELRLPPKAEYLPVLRATAGVIAGGMSFNYDEIIQVRAVVAEAFELTARRIGSKAPQQTTVELTVRFTITSDRLEILIPAPQDTTGRLAPEEELESEALLRSLMDEVDLGEAAGEPSICLIKYRAADET